MKKRNNKIILFLVILMLLFTMPTFFTQITRNLLVSNSQYSLNVSSILQKLNQFVKESKESVRINRDLTKYKDKKLIAFTFDDGPKSETTNLLLDGLDKYDAKVTFFIAGTRIANNEEVIKKAYLSGHDIGSHTYNHKNLFLLKNKNVLTEIVKVNETLKEITGEEPIYLRPPYGNVNDRINGLTDMYIICWDVDSLDWKSKNRDKIKEKILDNAHDGAIVLLHDIYEESVMGAFLAMEELEKQGYAFVTISEMAILKGIDLDSESVYYHF